MVDQKISSDEALPEPERSYTDDFEEIVEAEEQMFRDTKRDARDRIGLALSGGGIRSASFGLGVLQSLARYDLLRQIDYLSTVSGGGYIGSSLTYWIHRGRPVAEGRSVEADTTSENFPFGKRATGNRRADTKANGILDFIRQHGQYLIPSRKMGLFALVGTTLRGTLASLLFFFGFLLFIMLVVYRVNWGMGLLLADRREAYFWVGIYDRDHLNTPIILGFGCIVYVVLATVYDLIRSRRKLNPYQLRVKFQRRLGYALICLLVSASLGLVLYIYSEIEGGVGIAGIVTAIGSALGVHQYRQAQNTQEMGAFRSLMEKSKATVISAVVILGSMLLAYAVAVWVLESESMLGFVLKGALLLGYGVLILFVSKVSANYFGHHRMYRDRLMELFMADDQNVLSQRWSLAKTADTTKLENVVPRGPYVPYHLINTSVNLVDSNDAKFRDRGGDSFVLSPLYCGSDATGWVRTETFMKNKEGKGRGMTLPTAMAISGAAVNAHSGGAGRGVTRNRVVSLLMTLLNIRLGYWAPSPRNYDGRANRIRPNQFNAGLCGGVLGSKHREDSDIVELSDGGHFENLAAYELIRRRVKTIVVSDAGQDNEFKFSDLSNLVQRVRVDFGVVIRFRTDDDEDIEGMLPGSHPGKDNVFVTRFQLAKRGYAIADIYYPAGNKADVAGDSSRTSDRAGEKHGILIYLKTTLTDNLPADLYGYRSANPQFPDQSTGDQFFDEQQFEAYRELGYRIGERFLVDNIRRSEAAKKGKVDSSWLPAFCEAAELAEKAKSC